MPDKVITRILTIKTNIVEVFDDILNGKNSSLKTKIRERIKEIKR